MHLQHSGIHQRCGHDSVAVLAPDALADGEGLGYMTVSERDWLSRIRNEKRRKRWLAGRLAGKYLYLSRQTDLESTFGPEQSRLVELTRHHIRSFPPSMYHGVEILPGLAGAAPRLCHADGAPGALEVSFSHTDELTCACLARGAVGIDIERSVRRSEPFYRINFTGRETQWVREVSGQGNVCPAWLYTMLWSLKESALKSIHGIGSSIWNIPNIEIDVLAHEKDWAELCRDDIELGNTFLFFTVRINERSTQKYAQIALTATRHLILVILKPVEATQ